METDSIQQLKSILILEDDIFQAKMLAKKLDRRGYKSKIVRTGVQALEIVQKEVPDIVILDIELIGQNIDGLEVGETIQAFNENIIIIYFTGHSTDENFEKSLPSKPFAFIDKTVSIKLFHRHLKLAVQQVMQKREEQIIENKNQQDQKNNAKILCFPDSLWVKDGVRGYRKILLNDILYFRADGPSTDIITKNGKICPILLLKEFDAELTYSNMIRVHNSYMVNLDNIVEKKVKSKGGELIMMNGEIVKVSQSYVEVFKKKWEDYLNNKNY